MPTHFNISDLKKGAIGIFYLIVIWQHNHCRLTYYSWRDYVKGMIINIDLKVRDHERLIFTYIPSNK